MPISQESVDNFRRGIAGDSFLGVVIQDPNSGKYIVHLCMAARLDGQAIDNVRLSIISGQIRQPLPGAGGHARLVNMAGGQANQVVQGQAVGQAIGFSIIKTGDRALRIGSYRSGFNSQYQGERPAFAPPGHQHHARTLRLSEIEPLHRELQHLGVLEQYQP